MMNYKVPTIKIIPITTGVICGSNSHDNGNHNGFDHSGHYGYNEWVGEEE